MPGTLLCPETREIKCKAYRKHILTGRSPFGRVANRGKGATPHPKLRCNIED